VLNAADEVAVAEFLAGNIPFPGIAATVAETLEHMPSREPASIAEVLEIDQEARRVARDIISSRRIPSETAVRA